MAKETTKSNKGFWAKFLVAFVFLALFVCGMAVGLSMNRGGFDMRRGPMTEVECAELEKKIMFMEDAREQRKLSVLYNRQCWKKFGKRGGDNSPEGARPAEMQPQQPNAPTERTCAVIEDLLNKQLAFAGRESSLDPEAHLERAQMYANLAARGCPENAPEYKNLALHEIEIARALANDKFEDDDEVIELIETYKKLDMKREAEQVIEKMKKITDPAIDFILQVEKIINE